MKETSFKVIRKFKEEISKKFEMSYLDKITYYLGIEVIQETDEIRKKKRYAQKIMCNTKIEACNATHVPMEAYLTTSRTEDEREIDDT